MSLYLIVFLFLMVLSVWEFVKGAGKKQYYIALGVLSFLLVFRYGQGTDYLSYSELFYATPRLFDFQELLSAGLHGEPGWVFICALFRQLDLPFELLVILLSVLFMWLLHRFIHRYCKYSVFALLLAFPTIYMTYAVSVLRQAFALFVFLGILLPLLEKRKYILYCLITAGCALIHSSALVFLAAPFLRFFYLNWRRMAILSVLAAVGGFLLSKLMFYIPQLNYYSYSTPNVLAIGERCSSTLVMALAFWKYLAVKPEKRPENKIISMLLQIYLLGTLIYLFFWWNALISSRFCIYFKAVEIALFVLAIKSGGKRALAVAVYCLVLCAVLYYKNIDSYILQGNYYDFVNVFNYPWISIFNRERILDYRNIVSELIFR